MKHTYTLDGCGYRLRPVEMTDAQFVVDTRLEDMERNRFIHPISPCIFQQEEWLKAYFEREGDCYFIIENRLTGQPEGLIAFYNMQDGKAEWGRWVIRRGSFSAVESVYLLYRIAFEQAGLQELYCRTVAENTAVVSFHSSIGEQTRAVHPKMFELNQEFFDAVEQYADQACFYEIMAPKLKKQAMEIYRRNLKRIHSLFTFHHIGVAAKSIEKALSVYTLLGYVQEGGSFEDPAQGIRGVFLTAEGCPRLELLENLPGSTTLDQPLRQGQRLYHIAFYVEDIERAIDILKANRAKMISPMKESVYFKKRICFLMMSNMLMIELLEM